MIYGLIIAAGKQSRFESDIPKALVPYKGRRLLDINVDIMKSVCDVVYVVVSNENKELFDGSNRISIDSGYGCGDAVYKALCCLNITDEDTVFIQWGDATNDAFIFRMLKYNYTGEGVIIPCVWEDNPYVQVKPVDENHVKVLFSKYKEPITAGWHDLSLFYGNALQIWKYLNQYSKVAFDNSAHGNEMQFLDVFNYTDITAEVMPVVDYKSFSFNTKEEYLKLVNRSSDVSSI